MDNRKIILSVRDLEVKFRVRGRILTAIRGIDLDIYENESIAIVGESGSGKSVFTKTFAGMLDSNGFISNGTVIFNDDELSDTRVALDKKGRSLYESAKKRLDADAPLSYGAEAWKSILTLEAEQKAKSTLSDEEELQFDDQLAKLAFDRTEEFNRKQTLDPRKEKDLIKESDAKIEALDKEIKAVEEEKKKLAHLHAEELKADTAWQQNYHKRMEELKAEHQAAVSKPLSAELSEENALIAKEITLAIGRYPFRRRVKAYRQILKDFREARRLGVDLSQPENREQIFGKSALYVRFTHEDDKMLYGEGVLDMSKITNPDDWTQIRGSKIATVFQDPMTSLNPIITIGEQITSVILKHQNCSEVEARKRALILMKQVGIPNAENRFDDYPFQYSGGMRQRIVIAIALSCQPEILICDEPTTAVDVTIQAQILQLLKDLQEEYNYTIVFITHDLGVVANVADRVAVMYAGQIIEIGTVEEVFYDPRHPYTWALLSSLPQLAERGVELYSITGTPPSLYNKVVGDAFAPRNPYCMKIDTIAEPPMFPITETHAAKTWLLDPRAPKMEKPAIIQNIHEKLLRSLNIVDTGGVEDQSARWQAQETVNTREPAEEAAFDAAQEGGARDE